MKCAENALNDLKINVFLANISTFVLEVLTFYFIQVIQDAALLFLSTLELLNLYFLKSLLFLVIKWQIVH